ncbi:peptidase S24 [Flavobacterium sp. Root901]|uniref:S24 family peptidase n=1 Tax=Flavobacterium sp. Root901 TaxID=1736605 RepID=UPI00070D2011|nr:S24 family peptidase [Flavobacterium sp. Root901]KRD11712.1 peptidase S24 [Flavobacterium sp. Root901]
MAENTIQRIKKYIDAKGIKVSVLEREVGMSNGSFASQLKNNKTIGIDKLENILKKYTDINLEWLLTGQGSMLKMNTLTEKDISYKQIENYNRNKTSESLDIPLYDISTTEGIQDLFGENKSQKPVDFISISKISDYDGALFVVGDSMYPLLSSRDIVVYKIVHNPENNIIWGEMYLIYVNNDGNEFFFTRFLIQSKRKSYVQLVPHNTHYQIIEFPISSIKALALVKASVRITTQF